ncbi:Zn-dependent hydrolase [Mycobacteroides abscessus subsp. massiliense]|nr:Zn-dependent hydrolase [Mycobacteroides abscessus subsp. massiliense]
MTTKTSNVRQIRSDLWETRTDNPFPGLTTHAYLWVRPEGNVLFYSPATESDFISTFPIRTRQDPCSPS